MRFIATVVRLTFLIAALSLIAVSASAQITPLGDSYTNTAAPTTKYGANVLLDVDGASEITYIQFPLSSIPSGATVSGATLKLYVNAIATAGSFNVDYVNGTWAESTIDASNAPPLGGTIASGVSITTADKNQYILINVTSAVQAWLSGSETNNGIALVANSTFDATFDSKENTGTSHPAELDIAYAGGDGTITGVTTASGSGLSGGGTSGTLNLSLTNACAANQVLEWSGSAWACSNAGTGTITGVTAGTDLTGGGTGGNVTLNVNTTALNSTYAQLAVANTFTGNQTVNGNLSATGMISGSGLQIGSSLFAFGNYTAQNAFMGFAGNTTVTGSGNTATGTQALSSLSNGGDNTANGFQALYSNTQGLNDTAIGFAALYSNIYANANTAIGSVALYSDTTGYENTASGMSALANNTSGSNNTAAGFQAGLAADNTNITGSDDTFLGSASALGTGSLSNATAIGSFSEVTESNALVLGSIKGVNSAGSSVNVGIGTTAPAYSLDVYGTGHFTQAVTFGSPVNFASGQTFPGAGTITGVTAGTGLSGGGSSGGITLSNSGVLSVAAGTGISVTSGQSPTVSVNAAQVPLLSSSNTFTGNQTVNGNLSATGVVTGSGFQIGSNLFDYGSYTNENAFLGFAGNTATTGALNTASGFGALTSDTTGSDNTASGIYALAANTSGSYNAASGGDALANNTTGCCNTAYGNSALDLNTTGSANTAIGIGAGYTWDFSWITGSNNTFIGGSTIMSTGNLSNATAIGFSAEVAESNALVLGSINGVNGALADTLVGIGITTPAYKLHVGTINKGFRVEGPAQGTTNPVLASFGGSGDFGIDAVGTAEGRFVVKDSSGYVGINTATPDTNLSVNGNADKSGGGSWSTFSDRRLKDLSGTFNSGLDEVLKLQPIRYRYKDDNGMGIRDREEHVGFVAQEVQKVIPEAVTENSKGYLLVNNDPILWTMLNAIKEQQKLIQKQQRRIAQLTSQVKTIQTSLRNGGRAESEVRTVNTRPLVIH
jgi:hypothetical protein